MKSILGQLERRSVFRVAGDHMVALKLWRALVFPDVCEPRGDHTRLCLTDAVGPR